MRKHRVLSVALLTTLILVAFWSTAIASTGIELTPSEGELGRVTVEGRAVTFAEPGRERPEFSVICDLGLTLSLHRSIAKVAGTLAGQVTATAAARNCRGGIWRFTTTRLPWHVTYRSFSGVLPNISSIRLRIGAMTWLLEAFFGASRCQFSGDVELVTNGNPIREVRVDETISYAVTTQLGEVLCPRPSGAFLANLSVRPTVRMTLTGPRRCETPPAIRVDEAFQRQEATNATIGMTAQVQCDGTRLDSIRTTRANESIGIEDRERAVGRTFRRGESFRYDLRLTAREGTRVVEETVEIAWTEEAGASSRGTTRVRFTDL